MNCVIVDDELMARKYLEKLCQKENDLEVLAVCENAEEALEILNDSEVDILFLDIEMPGLSGFDLLNHLAYQPNVIMTTSHRDYAFEAFEYEVTDFLKKPISLPRFRKAVEKVRAKQELMSENGNGKEDEFNTDEIYVKDKNRLVKVRFEEILFIENVGDYVKLVTTDKKNYVIHGTIKSFAKKLPDRHFLKVHRSYIINIHKIKDIEGGSLVIDGNVIPVSRSHKSMLMDRLKIL
jgi:DNA-binding LytR/AlgR family response regulator